MAVRVQITRSLTTMELRGAEQALSDLRSTRAQAAALGDDLLVALSYIQESSIHGRLHDWGASLAALDAVGAGAEHLDPAQQTSLHINRGMTSIYLEDLQRARSSLETAADLAARHGLREQEFMARHDLAHLAFVDGEVGRALHLMREADAMEVDVHRDRARLDHAEVLLFAGLVDKARTMLVGARSIAQREGHLVELGEISLWLAQIELLAGRFEQARVHVDEALTAYRQLGAEALFRDLELVRATIDIAAQHELTEVVALLSSRDRTKDAPRSNRRAARLEAEARLVLDDLDGAERLLPRAGQWGAETSLDGALHDALLRAQLDLRRGRDQEALDRLVEGNRLLAAQQFQSSSLAVRAGLALHGRRLADLDVERALTRGDLDDVLDTVERWRAVSHRIRPVTMSSDTELASLTRELRRLRQLGPDGDDDGSASRIAELESEVEHREWSLAVERSADEGTSAATAQEARQAVSTCDCTVVEFFESGGRLRLLIVRDSGLTMVDLGPVAGVVEAVTRLRRDLRARAQLTPDSPMAGALERATESSLAKVDALLNPELGGDRRVVVVPSRSLAGVPWSLLPSLRGRPVTVAPSLTRWLRGSTSALAGAAEREITALFGPGLVRTAPEIRAILDVWSRPVDDTFAPAGSEDVVAALSTSRIVHLAAHGSHEGQSPLFSSVVMANGPVFAHEFPRPVAAEHVVLSACDVGQFSTRPGDEPLGLAVALLSLGATSVLAAVAPVEDGVAQRAMVAYHRRLAAGGDAAGSWAAVVDEEPLAGVFCLYGSDWRA